MTPVTIEQAMQRAIGHHRAGRLAEAEAIYRQVLGQAPDHPDALHLLGALACQTGHTGPAIELVSRAIRLQPEVAEYHGTLAEAYRRAGETSAALAHFHRALELKPDLALAHGNLGSALLAEGRLEDAIAAFRRSIALDPRDAVVHGNLGAALMESGRAAEAIAAHEQALALDPKNPVTARNLGVALHAEGRTDEAIAAYERALTLRNDDAKTYNNLRTALQETGRLDEAIAAFRQAFRLSARPAEAYSSLLFMLHFHPDVDAQALLAEHRVWAEQYAMPAAGEMRPHHNDRSPDRTLRIGFVSPDFRGHPVGRLVLPLFQYRDRSQAEFFAYSDVRTPDALTQAFKARSDRWQSIVALSDAQVAERIRADRIDILVDLAVHTPGNRLLVFARKPAPVQVSMLGMPTTTGLSTIAYRITDPYLDPPGSTDADYSEQTIRLPRCSWVFQAPAEAPPVNPLPAEQNGFVTFGCVNPLSKINAPLLALWVKILQALPGARLVLQAHPGSHLEAVRAPFEQGGIARQRIRFLPRVNRVDYFQRYHDLDLCLDPFPYSGHTSTLDALWMGVPIVTLAGRTGVGRGGVCILSNVGLTELIARTPEEYLAIAVALARDLNRLSALRSGLRQRMMESALMDGRQYAVEVEKAFRGMWRTWCDR